MTRRRWSIILLIVVLALVVIRAKEQRLVDLDAEPNTGVVALESNYYPGEIERITLSIDGHQRFAYIYIPKSLTNTIDAPSVYVLHGGGGGGVEKVLEKVESDISITAEAEGIVFVLPESLHDRQWNDGRPETAGVDDVAFISALKDKLEEMHGLSSDRTYASGVSNGGLLTQWIACTSPDLFAGYAPVIANLVTEVSPLCTEVIAKPVVFFHGSSDRFMPYEGGEILKSDALGKGVGGTVFSAEATVDYWADKLDCGKPVVVERLDKDPDDGTEAVHAVWSDCREGSALEHYVIEGGGHTYFGAPQNRLADRLVGPAGAEVNVIHKTVEFFKKHGL